MKIKNAFELLSRTFEKEHIDFALIGAVALSAYGYVRATRDFDFIAGGEDQPMIVGFLESWGFATIHRSGGYTRHAHPASEMGLVDVVHVRGKTAERIFRDVRKLPILPGVMFPVVSPEHLAALKVFAMEKDPGRALREMADIQRLLSLTGLTPRVVRKYFVQYGRMENYFAVTGESPDDTHRL